jgi:hypothetical protein
LSKHKHTGRNPNFDPNMLLILLLILSAYSQKPMYNFDEELLNNQHNGASNNDNDADKASDTGYTGDVLSEDNDSQDEAGSNTNHDSSPITSSTDDTGYMESRNSSNLSEDEAYSNSINENCEKKDVYLITLDSDDNDNTDCRDAINSEVIHEYSNKLITPDVDFNQVVVHVPVLLSQFEIEFACETIIKLDCPALDVKRIKKNVYLDECRLLPKVNKLFIGGIVRKNIEYSTEANIRHATIEVPFKCATEVKYFTSPVINSSEEVLEIETLRSDGMGIDLSEKTYVSSENFNEKIYCKLVDDEIEELDIIDEDKGKNENPECERLFETLTEKMVVKLNLKLMQVQEIRINK